MTDIAITALTNSTTATDGTGIFDVLINAVELHIVEQYEQGRITGEDYAKVYLGSIQSTVSEAIRFLLDEQKAGLEADLLTQKINSEIKNNEVNGVIDLEKLKIQAETALLTDRDLEQIAATIRTDAESAQKIALMAAQTLGFKTDAKQKLLKQMLDGYAATLSIAGSAIAPQSVISDSIDAIANDLLSDLDGVSAIVIS